MKWWQYTLLLLSFLMSLPMIYAESSKDVSKIPELQGLTMDETIKRLGSPEKQESFLIGDGLNEFRVELLNIYPLTDSKNRKVRIKELWWKEGDYFVTLWFHQIGEKWVALDSRRWHKGLEF